MGSKIAGTQMSNLMTYIRSGHWGSPAQSWLTQPIPFTLNFPCCHQSADKGCHFAKQKKKNYACSHQSGQWSHLTSVIFFVLWSVLCYLLSYPLCVCCSFLTAGCASNYPSEIIKIPCTLYLVLSVGINFFSCVFQNGFAVVRPPGHHAEESTPM